MRTISASNISFMGGNKRFTGRLVGVFNEKSGDFDLVKSNGLKEDRLNKEYLNELKEECVLPMTKDKVILLNLIEIGNVERFKKELGKRYDLIDTEYFYEAIVQNRLDLLKWLYEKAPDNIIKLVNRKEVKNIFHPMQAFSFAVKYTKEMYDFISDKIGGFRIQRMVSIAFENLDRELLSFCINHFLTSGTVQCSSKTNPATGKKITKSFKSTSMRMLFTSDFLKYFHPESKFFFSVGWIADFFIAMEDLGISHKSIEIQLLSSLSKRNKKNGNDSSARSLAIMREILSEYISEHIKMRDMDDERKQYLEKILSNLYTDKIDNLSLNSVYKVNRKILFQE